MPEIVIDPVYGLIIAIMVLWTGALLTRKIAFLAKYKIPTSVSGGILCSVVVAVIYFGADVQISFDLSLRDTLLLAFFSTIGLSARFSMLLQGGKLLLILTIAAALFLLIQNLAGILVALAYGARSDPPRAKCTRYCRIILYVSKRTSCSSAIYCHVLPPTDVRPRSR